MNCRIYLGPNWVLDIQIIGFENSRFQVLIPKTWWNKLKKAGIPVLLDVFNDTKRK